MTNQAEEKLGGNLRLSSEELAQLTEDGTRPVDMRSSSSEDSLISGATRAIGASSATDAFRSARRDLKQGASISRFLVLEKLGEGGMGVVYAAYDPSLNRRVALKLLLVDESQEDPSDARLRLIREAQALAQLSHPGVVAVYEVGEHEGDVFIAMEFVDGSTLKDWLKEQERPWREVLAVCIEAGRGLAAAHAAGLVHRDFKPANVLVGSDGRVRVMDFGLARSATGATETGVGVIAANAPPAADASGALLSSNVTRYGVVMGTPAYMAPEQRKGYDADARSDQYSYCVSLFEALYGEKPDRENAAATAPPRGSGVPPWVHVVLVRGLQQAPAARFPSMDVLLKALAADPTERRKKLLAIAATALLVPGTAAAAAAYHNQQRQICKGAEDNLAGIWDKARREQVQTAMLATGVPYAASMWSLVAPRLDAYADAWVQQHTEACEATHVRGEVSAEALELRMACLRDAQVRLHAAVDVLASADARSVSRAHRVVDGFETLSRCGDVELLRTQAQLPLQREDAEMVAVAREHLAKAAALREAGRYAEATAAVEAAEVLLASSTHEPLQTEVSLEKARLLGSRGDHERSEATFKTALESGAKWKQWTELREASMALLHVVGTIQERPAEALHYLDLALGLVEDDADLDAEGRLRTIYGNVLAVQEKYAEAEAEHRHALALREKLFGPNHPALGNVLVDLARAIMSQGKLAEAEAEYRRALALLEKTLGPEHPQIALPCSGLASNLLKQQRPQEALVFVERAWELEPRDEVLTPEAAMTAFVLARALWESDGDKARARALAERAAATYEGAGEAWADERDEIRTWLRTNGA